MPATSRMTAMHDTDIVRTTGATWPTRVPPPTSESLLCSSFSSCACSGGVSADVARAMTRSPVRRRVPRVRMVCGRAAHRMHASSSSSSGSMISPWHSGNSLLSSGPTNDGRSARPVHSDAVLRETASLHASVAAALPPSAAARSSRHRGERVYGLEEALDDYADVFFMQRALGEPGDEEGCAEVVEPPCRTTPARRRRRTPLRHRPMCVVHEPWRCDLCAARANQEREESATKPALSVRAQVRVLELMALADFMGDNHLMHLCGAYMSSWLMCSTEEEIVAAFEVDAEERAGGGAWIARSRSRRSGRLFRRYRARVVVCHDLQCRWAVHSIR